MHSLCLVAGHSHDAALEPFADFLKVERYKCFLEDADVTAMAEHLSVPREDLGALASRMPEWQEAEGGIEDDRLFFWSTDNPKGKYDWYRVGGTFAGYLHLRVPRAPKWWERLVGRGPTDRVNQARKHEVVLDAILADPPSALVHNGEWYEAPLTHEVARFQEWKQGFPRLFSSVGGEERLTVVDLHS